MTTAQPRGRCRPAEPVRHSARRLYSLSTANGTGRRHHGEWHADLRPGHAANSGATSGKPRSRCQGRRPREATTSPQAPIPPRAPPAHPPATEPPRLRQGWRRQSRTTSTRRTTQPTRPPPFPLPLEVHPPPARQRGEAPRHFHRPPASARRRRGLGFAVPGSEVGTKAATAGGRDSRPRRKGAGGGQRRHQRATPADRQ